MSDTALWTRAAVAAAHTHVRDVVRRSGTTFQWGMRLLPPQRRSAMYALYAFCRTVDDIADEPGDIGQRRAQLGEWRTEIDRLFQGVPTQPIGRALADPVLRYALPREEFLAIIDGMAMDLDGLMVAPSEADLETYCRRVAGAVGLLSVRIFGASGAISEEIAVQLGEALQLTNILRDLREDGERGRLYLPRERFAAHGISPTTPAAVLAHPNLSRVCGDIAAQAHACFGRVRALLSRGDRRHLRPCIIMMEMYERVLSRLVSRGWVDIERNVAVPRTEKLWIVLRHGLF